MIQHLSRRGVVVGLGCTILGATSITTVAAAVVPPLRTIEELFGPHYMARIAALCREAPVQGELARIVRDKQNPERALPLLDAHRCFRLQPEFREALTLFMNGRDPVVFTVEAESWDKRFKKRSIDNAVWSLAEGFRLLSGTIDWQVTFDANGMPHIHYSLHSEAPGVRRGWRVSL